MKRPLKLRFNNMLAGKSLMQIIALIAVIAMVVFVMGLFLEVCGLCLLRSFFDTSFAWEQHLQLVNIIGSFLFGGLLIPVITNSLLVQVKKIDNGEVEYNLSGHTVIIGFDDIVPSLVFELLSSAKDKDSVVLIHSCQPVTEIKSRIFSACDDKMRRRIIFMHSSKLSHEELERLHTVDARELFVIGDRTESGHDSENMHIVRMLLKIHDIVPVRKIRLNVWFENEASYSVLQLNDIASMRVHTQQESSRTLRDLFVFVPRNFYKDWANRLLTTSKYQCIEYPELDGKKGISKDSTKHVHVVIIGMNRMGIALAKEVGHLMHFPNFDCTDKTRTLITFIDDNADVEMNFFKGRHPGYFQIAPTLYCDAAVGDVSFPEDSKPDNFLDVQYRFIKGRGESPAVRDWLVNQVQDKDQLLSIAVCLEDPSQSLGMALYLPEQVYFNDRAEDEEVNIFVRQANSSYFIESLRQSAIHDANKKYEHVYAFGMYDRCLDMSNNSYIIPVALNYVYVHYFDPDPQINKTIPSSLPPSEVLNESFVAKPISLQWSNIYLADSLEFKFRAFGLDINGTEAISLSDDQAIEMAQVEHNRWNMEKLLMGYRAPGPDEMRAIIKSDDVKSAMKNTRFVHSDIRPTSEISKETFDIDLAIVNSLPMIVEYRNNHSATPLPRTDLLS